MSVCTFVCVLTGRHVEDPRGSRGSVFLRKLPGRTQTPLSYKTPSTHLKENDKRGTDVNKGVLGVGERGRVDRFDEERDSRGGRKHSKKT